MAGGRRPATGTFGGHASVATVLSALAGSRDSASPPPVPMSSIVRAPRARAETRPL
jgi:hypothetical protein